MATAPEVFRSELGRLYADAHAVGFISDDLATWAGCEVDDFLKWINGYTSLETSDEREAILLAISHGFKEAT